MSTTTTTNPRNPLPIVGQRRELERYTIPDAGQRILYGQRIDGHVRVTDVPARGHGRAYLVERELEQDGYQALKALVATICYADIRIAGTMPTLWLCRVRLTPARGWRVSSAGCRHILAETRRWAVSPSPGFRRGRSRRRSSRSPCLWLVQLLEGGWRRRRATDASMAVSMVSAWLALCRVAWERPVVGRR